MKLRHLLLRKTMTNLDSILKSRDITLPINVHWVKAMVFPIVMYKCDSWNIKKAEQKLMFLNCDIWEDSWESLGLQRDQTSQSWKESTPNINWKDWCWSWSSNTLAIWHKEMIHWRRLGKIEGRRRRGRGQDGCMVSSTQCTLVWAGWMVSPTQ